MNRTATSFAARYATAPAIRRIGHDEVKPGMVVRAEDITDDGQHHSWTFRATEPVPVSALAAYDYIYLIKDDQREDLAEQLYEAFSLAHPTSVDGAWRGLPQEHRERWRRAADVAIRWFGEQSTS